MALYFTKIVNCSELLNWLVWIQNLLHTQLNMQSHW